MNDPVPNEQLLADVLGEGAAEDSREGMLDETLHLARRRRRFRQVRNAASALALLTALGLLVWLPFPSARRPAALPTKPYTLVRTQPLPPAAWVETRPFPASSIVASARTDHIVVTAEAGTRVRDLTDDELLALAPQPAALVRFGPHSAELVLVNAVDRKEPLGN
jgi:ferric-dicitrate binding protein FerR (iron transport regulator)